MPMTTTPATKDTAAETAAKKDVTKLQRAIVDGLEDVKAQDIQVFNTEHLSPLFERVIVATGSSNRQTKALAASVRDAVREAGFAKPRTEGEENGEWIIVDCGAAVVHVMQPAIRQYYRLEEIWGEKPVRLKLAAAKPRKITASSEEDAAPAAKKVAKKVAAPRAKAASAAPDATATPAPAKKRSPRSAAAPQASQPSAAVKKAPAKKAPARKTAASTAPASASPATKAPAKKTRSSTAVKTVVIQSSEAKKPAAKKAAAKAPAKKAPAKKTRTTQS